MGVISFLEIVFACYLGCSLAYLTVIFTDNGMPLKYYYGNEDLYNVMFIHLAAKKYEKEGLSGDDLVNKLQATKFGFMTAHENRIYNARYNKKSKGLLKKLHHRKIERIDNKLEQAYIFAMKVLNDKVLLEQFIIPDGFDEDTYLRLCQATEENQKYKDVYSVIKNILTCQTDENVRKMMPLLAQWNTRPFLTDSPSSEQTTAGKYQSYLFQTLKSPEIQIIKCDQKQYINAMIKLRELYTDMDQIRRESTMSSYSKEYSENNPDIRHMKEIIKQYVVSK